MDPNVDPAVLGSEIGATLDRLAPREVVDANGVGNAWLVRHALPDHLQRHDLNRLFGAGAVTVGVFVLLAKGLLELVQRPAGDAAVGQRDRQLEGLALVAEAGRAAHLGLVRSEPLPLDRVERVRLHRLELLGEERGVGLARARARRRARG